MEQAFRLFYGTMPPWEHEEIGCMLGYFESKIKSVFEEIAHDLHQLSKDSPRAFFHELLPPEEQLPICDIETQRDIEHLDNNLEGLAGLGPDFLYRVLHVDRTTRRNIICINTRAFWPGPFIGLNIDVHIDDKFPLIEPADKYERPSSKLLWSSLPLMEQPSAGWRQAWGLPEDEQDVLEIFLSRNGGKSVTDWVWGYALWDEERLREWKAFVPVDDEVREDRPRRVFVMPYP